MPVAAPVPRSSTLVSWRGVRIARDGHARARHLVDETPALVVGAGDQLEQTRVQHDRREQLAAGLEHLDVGGTEVARIHASGRPARRSSRRA